MYSRNASQQFDSRLEGRGYVAAGTEGGKPAPVGNSGAADDRKPGPEPAALPGGVEGEPESEMRPRENDPRKSDGVETFKRMESDAERHERQSD